MGLLALCAAVLALAALAATQFAPDGDVFVVALTMLSLVLWLNVALRALLWALLRLTGRTVSDRAAAPKPDTRRQIIVDGSNVMFWDRETPTLGALTAVLDTLIAREFAPVVYFDANVGYKLFGVYCGPGAMARKLPKGVARVVVVSNGEPADPILIAHALGGGNRIVSNDRFRDWRGQFPKLSGKGVLVRGEIKGGNVRLRL